MTKFGDFMEKLLEVKNLSISFTQYVEGLNRHNSKVITDLTIDVNENEIVAILGSSGSGKSLLAHSILGILPYNSHVTGNIKYKGETLNQELNVPKDFYLIRWSLKLQRFHLHQHQWLSQK